MSFFSTVEVGKDKPQKLVPPFLTELRQNDGLQISLR
jgi:hypothetical protein